MLSSLSSLQEPELVPGEHSGRAEPTSVKALPGEWSRPLRHPPPSSSCPVALCAFTLFLVLWHPLPVSS